MGTSLIVIGTLVANSATFTSSSLTPAAGDWGRIYFSPSSVDAVYNANGDYLSGSKLQDSQVESGGGGASIHGAIETNIASPFIYHNTIQYNITRGVYAISRSPSQRAVIKQNNLLFNSLTGGQAGGGIYISAGNAISNTLSQNYAVNYGGGIHAAASTVRGNTITGNRTDYEGAGIYASGSTVTNNTVSGNQNTGAGRGGGIFATSGVISNNVIENNTGTWQGGGIYASGTVRLAATPF